MVLRSDASVMKCWREDTWALPRKGQSPLIGVRHTASDTWPETWDASSTLFLFFALRRYDWPVEVLLVIFRIEILERLLRLLNSCIWSTVIIIPFAS